MKSIEDFGKRKRNNDGYDTTCKQCRKEYYEQTRDLRLQYQSNYDKSNKELTNQYRNNRRKYDKLFKLKDNLSSLLRQSLKGFKNKTRSEDILGCSIEEFKIFISDKFQEGMSWDNHGEWELDHIKPVCLGKTKEELLELNKFTNFQPLWKTDNRIKSGKYYC
mgnify:CR=1 FL=1|jgi:hypothetical protein